MPGKTSDKVNIALQWQRGNVMKIIKLHSRKQSGFTLIELMISSSLLMLIMYAGYFAYSLYSSSWQKQSNAYWQTTDQGIQLTSLMRVVEASMPYIVEDKAKQFSIYFQGNNQAVNFVSSAPIFSKTPAVISLELVNGTLVYSESSLDRSPMLKQNEKRAWEYNVKLLDNISQAQFSFYGWRNLQEIRDYELQQQEQLRGRAPINPRWYSTHQMESIRILPIKLSLTLNNKSQQTVSLTFFPPQHSQHELLINFRDDS